MDDLTKVLNLVGKLDDSSSEDCPRERFRRFLRESVTQIGQLRDYVQECLRNTGTQYNKALQDLVNHLGSFLGFEVAYGRYSGVVGQVGFDGHWSSARNFSVVLEVKTTDVYSIKTSTLIGYVDELISQQRILDWSYALGLYVIGRLDREVNSLENSIIAENNVHRLRVISIDSLLSLAELMATYDISHDDILAVIRPTRPTIDPIVDLMSRIVAGAEAPASEEPQVHAEPVEVADHEPSFWLTPLKDDEYVSAMGGLKELVGQEKVYAFGERTPGRKNLGKGDWICFYVSGVGVAGYARATEAPRNRPHPKVANSDKYPWTFKLHEVNLFAEKPIVIDANLRSRLEAFKGRDVSRPWAWFVQGTHKVSERDFKLLTGQLD